MVYFKIRFNFCLFLFSIQSDYRNSFMFCKLICCWNGFLKSYSLYCSCFKKYQLCVQQYPCRMHLSFDSARLNLQKILVFIFFLKKKKIPYNPHSLLWHGVSLEEFWLKHRMFSHARQWKDSNMNLTVWPNTLHLFEHLSYTYTVKINSELFRWQTPPPSRKTTPQTKKQHYYQLSCHAYVTMFHIPLQHRAVCHTSHVCNGVGVPSGL